MSKISHKITYNGITDSCYGWDKRLGLLTCSTQQRYRRYLAGKITLEEVFAPYRKFHQATHDGLTDTYNGWAKRLGIDQHTFTARMRKLATGKMTEEEAFRYGKIPPKQLTFEVDGKIYTTNGLAKRLGVRPSVVQDRAKKISQGKMKKDCLLHKGVIKAKERDLDPIKRFVIDGEKVSILDMEKRYNVSRSVISRLISTLPFEKVLEELRNPFLHYRGTQFVNGEKFSTTELAEILGISRDSLTSRRWRVANGFGTLSDTEIYTEQCVSHEEACRRACASRVRNQKRRDMLHMGYLV